LEKRRKKVEREEERKRKKMKGRVGATCRQLFPDAEGKGTSGLIAYTLK